MQDPDIVVVGAGAAGLAAAQALRALGRRVVVLEAKGRVGGRAYTSHHEFGVPFDHGCQWLHSASRNPFTALADTWRFRYRRRPVRRRLHLGDRWADAAETRRWQRYCDRQWRRIETLAREQGDMAAGTALQADTRWRPAFERWFAMLSAVEPDHGSALDQLDYRDSRENWPVREGFGTVVSRLAADLTVRTNCPVHRIRRTAGGVAVETAEGTVTAAAAIVTVPAGLLAQGRPAFEPALSPALQEAAHGLRAGPAEKIAIGFDRNVFELDGPASAMSLPAEARCIGFQLRPNGWNLAIGFTGGELAAAVAAMPQDDAEALAVEQLAAMFGSGLRRHVTMSVRTGWTGDAYIAGGYSASRPGHAGQRRLLATPWAERILFAGEATSAEYFSTAHGAYLSGLRAAAEAAALV